MEYLILNLKLEISNKKKKIHDNKIEMYLTTGLQHQAIFYNP